MRIAAIADTHGQLDFGIEPCDILIIAGDLCPYHGGGRLGIVEQEMWLINKFKPWFKKQPVKEVVGIAGNHDWIWDIAAAMVPNLGDNFHYLCDNEIEIMGLKIYGTPQQKVFNNWAFNRTPGQLKMYFDKIPEGLDILIAHTAPYKIMDKVDFPYYKGHEGDKILKTRIMEMKEPPKVNVFGHFHGCYGIEEVDYIPGVKFVNCSLVNEQYIMDKKPIYLEI